MAEKDTLNLERYPEEFQKFLKKEIEMVKNFVNSRDKVLDVGCGTGRAMINVSPIVSKYVGIDIDEDYLSQAKALASKFENSEIEELSVYNLSKTFNENEFDKSFCLFNTISCFKDYRKALEEIYYITKDKFYFSVCAKGSKEIRQKYYDMIGVEAGFDENETSFSSAWGQVRAFSEKEIKSLCEEIGFKVEKIILLEGYAYGITVSK